MERRRGLQAEILLSLAVVVVTATGGLGVALVHTHEANVRQLQALAGRTLLEEARAPLPQATALAPALRWWEVAADGRARARGAHGEAIDAGTRELARAAREKGRPLLRAGSPWEPVRFAAPAGDFVLAARLPPAASGRLLLAMLAADGLVFTAFGATLLRRMLVRPLQRLAAAAQTVAEGDLGVRAACDGPREVQELAGAFNQMTESLAARTGALEKAVADLRESNRSLRAARAGLDRAERLAAVGRLAAGVAHEVGNPLGAMLAFLDLAGRDPALAGASREHLARAAREAERVRGILRQLLDFSRPPRTRPGPVDVLEVARETAELVRAQRRYAGIAVEVAADGEVPPALADRSAVAQILLNLLLNAGDALAGTSAPRIAVRVAAAAALLRGGDEPGDAAGRARFDAVECRVADNGPGIPEEDRERIFDPFFTTKDPGEGTGLGLSNALRFAEELGGSLELAPEGAGEGACFVLRLPAQPGPGAGEALRKPLRTAHGDA